MPTVTRDPLSEPGIPRPNQAEYRETPISYRGKEITRTMSNKTLLQPIGGKSASKSLYSYFCRPITN